MAKATPVYEDVYKTTDINNRHDEFGREVLNPTPVQPPVGYKKQPSILDTIREQIRAHHLSNIDMEPETEEEADDFDIDEDPPDYQSRWENDTIPSIKETRARLRELERQERLYAKPEDPPPGPGKKVPAEPPAAPDTVMPTD